MIEIDERESQLNKTIFGKSKPLTTNALDKSLKVYFLFTIDTIDLIASPVSSSPDLLITKHEPRYRT